MKIKIQGNTVKGVALNYQFLNILLLYERYNNTLTKGRCQSVYK